MDQWGNHNPEDGNHNPILTLQILTVDSWSWLRCAKLYFLIL